MLDSPFTKNTLAHLDFKCRGGILQNMQDNCGNLKKIYSQRLSIVSN